MFLIDIIKLILQKIIIIKIHKAKISINLLLSAPKYFPSDTRDFSSVRESVPEPAGFINEIKDFSPEFWPEPGILTVQVCVHLHVITEVEHLRLQIKLTVLYDDNSLKRQTV